jgi:hypothetical protein
VYQPTAVDTNEGACLKGGLIELWKVESLMELQSLRSSKAVRLVYNLEFPL